MSPATGGAVPPPSLESRQLEEGLSNPISAPDSRLEPRAFGSISGGGQAREERQRQHRVHGTWAEEALGPHGSESQAGAM